MAELNAIGWWNRLREDQRKTWGDIAREFHPGKPLVQSAFKEYLSRRHRNGTLEPSTIANHDAVSP